MKKTKILVFLMAVIIMLSGCSGNTDSEPTETDSSAIQIDSSDMFTDRDMEIGYDETTAVSVSLNGDTASCDSDSINISGSVVTITNEGTYILSGTLNNGMIIVTVDDTEKVQLVLSGADITSESSAAIYVSQGDKVFITTAANTENILTNGGQYSAIDENNIDSVIFAKSDLTLNGAGTLTINAKAGHGIVSKDDLILTSGTYNITSASHALSGKDSVRIAAGTFNITSGKDGVHAENADDATLGFVYIADGTFNINSDGDSLSAENYMQINGGEYTLTAGGGSENGESHQETIQGFGRPGETSSDSSTDETDDTFSTKGVKAGGDLLLYGGTFNINSADDAIHSNSNIKINSGSYNIATGDDGVHADSNVSITDCIMNITESYEGIEGLNIDISGGEITLVASDDGLNAAGGNDESGFAGPRTPDSFSEASDSDMYIKISGGTLNIDASGDGIDSNGSLEISGGKVIVSGPDNGGNGALDYDSEAVITGGVFVATGSSQMAQNFSSSSTQGTMMVTVNSQQAGSTVILKDSSGNEIISWEAEKAYDSVIVSCPEITEGSEYTLVAGSSTTQVTMDSLVYGSSSGMGGGMPGGGFRDGAPAGENSGGMGGRM